MPTFSCAAILFDLDGVLVDSTGSVSRHWRVWAREHGIDEEKMIAAAHGVRTAEVIRAFAPHLNAEVEAQKLENREAEDHRRMRVMPGAVNLLGTIPQARWGVVTSGGRQVASERLQLAGIPVPKALVTADDVSHGKPHPEPYLKASALLGFAPAECLVIEDAPAGIQSAQAAGMKVIGLTSTFRASGLDGADAVANGFAQISVAMDGTFLQVKVG